MTDITKKQYVLSSVPRSIEGMREYKIGDNYLYTGDDLRVSESATADGKRVLLLGNAYCTDASGKAVCEDIAAVSGENVLSATRFWTGRWLLVTDTELVTDATGLMGAFYSVGENVFLVSSSLAVMAELLHEKLDQTVTEDGLSWQFLPGSRLDRVKTLFCTQQIVFKAGGLRVIPNDRFQKLHEYSTKEKCEAVAEMLVNAAKNIHIYSGKRIVLALTGGKDSRLTFAALIKSGIPFSSYTAAHKSISSSDKSVPAKLAKMFGVEHRFVRQKPYRQDLLSDYGHFCAGNSNGADADFYAHGQFDGFGEDVLVIRSGLFEAGQTYARSYTAPDMEGFKAGVIGYYTELHAPGKQRNAFEEWAVYATEHPIGGVDIRDRFYVEQRVGGWVSAIEQSLDINDFTSIQIANCEALLAILLSCTEKERKALALSYETMRLLELRVLEIPINKKGLADRLLRVKNLLRNPFRKLERYIHKRHRR